MDLSVIIVNWNTADLLEALLEQLTQAPAGAPATEILVVDNQSSDDSVQRVRERFPDAILLPQDVNGGFAFGVNRGLERARGRYAMLVNTDVELDWDAVTRLVAYADEHPHAGVIGPRILDEHGGIQPSHWRSPTLALHFFEAVFVGRLWQERSDPGVKDRAVDCVSGCVFLIRRETLEVVPRFDEGYFMYFEEVDYCERTRKAGFEVRYAPSVSMVHHGGLSSAKAREKTFLAFRRSCLRFHAVNRGRLRGELVRASLALASLLRAVPLAIVRPAKAKLHFKALAMLLHPTVVARAAAWANDHVDAHRASAAIRHPGAAETRAPSPEPETSPPQR